MPPASEPYRVLGLRAGASLDEVKRAYRRLAKANHPDTAGPTAIPRFLAIQAAYELLVEGRSGEPASDGAQPPWRADPARARAARESWQSRAGRRPPEPGASGNEAGGSAGNSAGSGAGPRRRRAGGRRTGSGPPRAPDRATPGSTSYDYAEHEPFDPQWSGASWYGQSSGTYWTINPKEYADPRKHGPEYQARARRGNGSGSPIEEPDGQPADAPPFDIPEPESRADPEPEPAQEDPGGAPPRADPPPRPRTAPPSPQPGDRRFRQAAGPAAEAPVAAAFEPLSTLRLAAFMRSRLGLALIGWPPIGIGLAVVLGEATGCGRFAATCVDSFELSMWIGQLAIILVLLIVPGLAAIAALGSLVTLGAAVPVAVVLSAAGGSRDPASAGVVLGAALAVAWLSGVVFALARRSRTVRA
jgi:hypothetical protein